jgi:RimJ/RimL family protein N-acetyltransferase
VTDVRLREVVEDDLLVFFANQLDGEATAMAAWPSRDLDAHMARWARILADETAVARTVLADGEIAGDIGSWEHDGVREVGYWLGRAFWGRGIATLALEQLLEIIQVRPIRAHVARTNVASARVLEKCGFAVVGEDEHDGGAELVLELPGA